MLVRVHGGLRCALGRCDCRARFGPWPGPPESDHGIADQRAAALTAARTTGQPLQRTFTTRPMDETSAERLSNDRPAEQTRELRVGQFPDGARRTLLSAHLYRFSVPQSRQWRGQPSQVTYAAKTNARDGPIRYGWNQGSNGQVTALDGRLAAGYGEPTSSLALDRR